MAKSLSPPPKFTVYLNGAPASNAKINTYEGGTTNTPIETYQDYDGTLNENPVVCDTRGECNLWLTPGVSYKFVVTDEDDNVIYTVDDVIGPSGSGSESFTSITITGNGSVFEGSVTFESTVNLEGDTTITLETGEEFSVITDGGDTFIIDGDGNIDMSGATSVNYLNGSILLEDLNSEVVNLILAQNASISSINTGNGRLTLVSGMPKVVFTVSPSATVYYYGTVMLLNDGSDSFSPTTITERSLIVTDTTKSPAAMGNNELCDVFGWDDAGTIRISRGLKWKNRGQLIATATNATPIVCGATAHGLATGDTVGVAFGQGLTAINGSWVITKVNDNSFSLDGSVGNSTYEASSALFACRGQDRDIEILNNSTYVNKSTITNGPTTRMGTYLGTIGTNGSALVEWDVGAAVEGGHPASFGIFNVSNQVVVLPAVREATTSWTYDSGTIVALNTSNGNRISYISGILNQNPMRYELISSVEVDTGHGGAFFIGMNSTSLQAPGTAAGGGASGSNDPINFYGISVYEDYMGFGYNFCQALQVVGNSGAAGNVEYFGATTVYTATPVYATSFKGSITL